jgi:uncharacterized membrane protein YgcG
MAWTRRLLASLVLALVLSPAMPATASTGAPEREGWAARSGDTGDFEFASFDSVYILTRGGDRHAVLDVVETAVAVFPSFDQNRGIIRSIPDYYGDVYLQTNVLGVVDDNGAPVYYEVQNDGGFTILIIDDDTYKHGATTYVIHYTQRDTIRSFGADDEFYWDVNGTGWQQPFGEVGAQVVVDAELTAQLAQGESCYQGGDGSTTPCSEGIVRAAEPDGGTRFTASARDLGPGENLTVVVPFLAGTFVEGTPSEGGSPYEPPPPIDFGPEPPAWAIALSLLGGAASLVTGIVGAVVLRRKRATPTGFIVPQYSVPKGLDVMVAAELIERGSTAVQAQLVSLAVKRKIRLLGYAVNDADGADYAVQLLDPTGLESWEQAVVDALFGPGAEAGTARDLQRSGDSELADALRPIVAALPGAITASGYEGPAVRTRGSGWVLLAVLATGVASIVGAIFAGWIGVVLGLFGFVFVAIGLGIAAFAARRRPTLSPHGAETVDYLLGMQMYLNLAEKDRFAVLQSATGAERVDIGDGRQLIKLYEKLLPWAVIWGVEESWARELEIQLQQTGEELDWYAGTAPFHAYQFATLLSGMHTGMSAPVTTSGSSWSGSGFSSFSSGSFVGGFSGGGGGGGGGGGR